MIFVPSMKTWKHYPASSPNIPSILQEAKSKPGHTARCQDLSIFQPTRIPHCSYPPQPPNLSSHSTTLISKEEKTKAQKIKKGGQRNIVKKSDFKIIHENIRGLRSKHDSLKIVLDVVNADMI